MSGRGAALRIAVNVCELLGERFGGAARGRFRAPGLDRSRTAFIQGAIELDHVRGPALAHADLKHRLVRVLVREGVRLPRARFAPHHPKAPHAQTVLGDRSPAHLAFRRAHWNRRRRARENRAEAPDTHGGTAIFLRAFRPGRDGSYPHPARARGAGGGTWISILHATRSNRRLSLLRAMERAHTRGRRSALGARTALCRRRLI